MASDEVRSRPLDWTDIASPDWYGSGQIGAIWLSAFLLMYADRAQISPAPLIIDFGDARAVAFYGQIPYLRFVSDEVRSTETPEFHAAPEQVTSPEGAYLLVVLPFDDSDPSRSESIIRARVTEISGLLVAVFGSNVAYRRFFDNVVRPHLNRRTVMGESFRNPASMPAPDIRQERTRLAIDADQAMKELPPPERNRVSLSLRWFGDAQHAKGVDLFLKLWFAIEALGMSDRDNLRPVVRALAHSYGIADQDARMRFAVGRLFGFRSKIVHQGEIHPIHANLSDYLAAIYLDVLYDRLGLPAQGFAAKVQQLPGFELGSYIG